MPIALFLSLMSLIDGSCAKIIACGGKRLVLVNPGELLSGLKAVIQSNQCSTNRPSTLQQVVGRQAFQAFDYVKWVLAGNVS